ncbi:hypothetical protein VDG1235_4766 [Verrucomicrobiia bacterium DG1235]|nr:hypothetical protein VDG1235_4766 [Verrucomicrobiae bacterium DG1235]
MLDQKKGPFMISIVFYKYDTGWFAKHIEVDQDFGKTFAESLKKSI